MNGGSEPGTPDGPDGVTPGQQPDPGPGPFWPPPAGGPGGYGAVPPAAEPGYGTPGYGPPGYGAPGYGTPGYGGPAQPAPGYGASSWPADGPGPPTYLKWGIIASIGGVLFCWLGAASGIAVTIYARQVRDKWAAGDQQGALRASSSARTWATVATVLDVLGLVIGGALLLLGTAHGVSSGYGG